MARLAARGISVIGATPSIGLLGFFDIPSFGDLLLPRIVESEVRARCPLAAVRAYAPLGRLHPVPLDGGRLAEPLGSPTPERMNALVREHALLLLAWAEDERDPWMLNLYDTSADASALSDATGWFSTGGLPGVSDKDPVLRLTGAGRDATLLVDRVFPPARRAQRVMHLRALRRWPSETPVVVDTDALASPAALAVTASVLSVLRTESPSRCVVAVDHQDRLNRTPPHESTGVATAYRVPALNLDDIAAAVGAAGLVVAASVPMALAALSFGVPLVLIRAAAPEAIEALTERLGLQPVRVDTEASGPAAVRYALSSAEREASAVIRARRLAEVDAFFDGLVDEMLASWERRIAQAGARELLKLATSLGAEAADLRIAHEARGLQLAEARARLVELTDTGS